MLTTKQLALLQNTETAARELEALAESLANLAIVCRTNDHMPSHGARQLVDMLHVASGKLRTALWDQFYEG